MCSAATYPYASGDLLDQPQTYFYTAYQGKAFLHAWRASRNECLSEHASPTCVEATLGNSATGRFLKDLATQLRAQTFDAAERGKLDAMLRNFEAKKRIYTDYNPGFTSKDRTDFRDLRLYIDFAEVLVLAYQRWQALPYLNALLKCVDIVCALHSELPAIEQQRLAQVIAAESGFVTTLSNRLGVEM